MNERMITSKYVDGGRAHADARVKFNQEEFWL